MSCTATIKLEESKPIVSSCDEIRGTVIIEMTKDIAVEQILLKLKGDIKTTVSYTKDNSKNSHRVARDEFLLYSRDLVLFPGKELRTQTSGKGFTLKSGRHAYKFAIRFPKGHHGEPQFLPPTLADKQGRFEIRHYLKVTIRRSSMFKSNTRIETPLVYSPCLPESMLADPRRQNASKQAQFAMESPRKSGFKAIFSSTKVENVDFHGECTFPRVGLAQAPYPMRLTLKVRVSQQVIIRDIKVQLEEITVWRASDIRNSVPREESTMVLRDLVYEQVNKQGSKFELSRLVDNVVCPEYLVPTFSSKLVDRLYNLLVIVTAANPNNPANVAQLVMKNQINVLPPQLHNHNSGYVQPVSPVPGMVSVSQSPSPLPNQVPFQDPKIPVAGPSSSPEFGVAQNDLAHLYEKPPVSDPPPYSR